MCRLEIKNEHLSNQYDLSFVFFYHERQHFFLVRLELLFLSNLGGTMDTYCAISSDTASKKRRITASTGRRDHRHVISNLNSMLVELADGECLSQTYHSCTIGQLSTENYPTGREPAALFMALDHFAQLASLHELPDFPVDIFVSSARRVIQAASEVLYSILETGGSLTKLEVLHSILRFLIETSFLVLPLSSESFGHLLFNQLSGLLLSPVIHSFFPLSMKSLGYLLAPNSTTPSEPQGQNDPDLHIDRRPKLLEFFQGIISGLFSAPCSLAKTASWNNFCQNASSMRDILLLETIRHLKGILSPIPIENHILDAFDATSSNGKKFANSQAEDKVDSRTANFEKYLRVRRLAVKDAMWYLCSVFHILIGSRTPYILSSRANSDNKLVDDLDCMQHPGSETLKKTILRELFGLLIDKRLRYEYPWLPSGTSQTPVDSLASTIVTGTAVKTTLLPSEEASSHRCVIRCERPMQQILTSNKQAKCFDSNRAAYTRLLEHTGCHDLKFCGTEVVNGIVTEGNHIQQVLDDAERGMLLCVVERYVNEQ